MRNKTLIQTAFRLLLLAALCWFAPPLNNAQTTRPKGIPEGYTVIDGDILLPTSYVEAVLKRQRLSPDAPQAAYGINVWKIGTPPFEILGIVPFEFDANVTPANQTAMINAMAVLENVANVDFQQCANNACGGGNFVHIVNHPSMNNSQVGMVGGEQFINIVSWGTQFIIVHELMHCLGFFHEHQRPDRNTFIQINCANVQGGCNGTLFNGQFSLLAPLTYGAYDFDSVMHYGQCAFTSGGNCPTDGTQTITVLAPNQNQQTLIGQLTHLSSLDQAVVSFLYPFDDWRFLDCAYNGNNGTSNGTFGRPYTTLVSALANTPPGGTIWILNNCYFQAVGTYGNRVTIRAAPRVTATFGG